MKTFTLKTRKFALSEVKLHQPYIFNSKTKKQRYRRKIKNSRKYQRHKNKYEDLIRIYMIENLRKEFLGGNRK